MAKKSGGRSTKKAKKVAKKAAKKVAKKVAKAARGKKATKATKAAKAPAMKRAVKAPVRKSPAPKMAPPPAPALSPVTPLAPETTSLAMPQEEAPASDDEPDEGSSAASAEASFVRATLVRGQAVPAGASLPSGATHEIVSQNEPQSVQGGRAQLKRKRFSAF